LVSLFSTAAAQLSLSGIYGGDAVFDFYCTGYICKEIKVATDKDRRIRRKREAGKQTQKTQQNREVTRKGQKHEPKKKKEKGPNEIHRRDPLTDFRRALTEDFLAELSGYWTIFGQKDLLAP
jgi:phosphosulfolactate phosphohydrolase-like enzyme